MRLKPAQVLLFFAITIFIGIALLTPSQQQLYFSAGEVRGDDLPKSRDRSSSYVVFGYNELGMHCMNKDFSEICILPPFNTLRAQVLRRGEEPQIVKNGVSLTYSIPGNTRSASKTNFWDYDKALFGTDLKTDIGLTGNGLSGNMVTTTKGDWVASGIPVTPIMDNGHLNPYPLSEIKLWINGKSVASTNAVVPVSWEISCDLCHNTPGISVATDILRKHDRLHKTRLEKMKPVLCASCHADIALGTTGALGVPNLSQAMHKSHSTRMTPVAKLGNTCYACHPGFKTNCQRDNHAANGITCVKCHGDMAAVGKSTRRPWVDEPNCGSCHKKRRPEFDYEEPFKLYKESRGHGGVFCSACHGPQHATGPAITAPDNVQAIQKQGHAGPIAKCTVCHTQQPDEPFFHSLED